MNIRQRVGRAVRRGVRGAARSRFGVVRRIGRAVARRGGIRTG